MEARSRSRSNKISHRNRRTSKQNILNYIAHYSISYKKRSQRRLSGQSSQQSKSLQHSQHEIKGRRRANRKEKTHKISDQVSVTVQDTIGLYNRKYQISNQVSSFHGKTLTVLLYSISNAYSMHWRWSTVNGQ